MPPSHSSSSPSSLLRIGLVAALVSIVAPAMASAAIGRYDSFSGKTCSLFTAKQIAAIVADTKTGAYKCVAAKTVKTRAGTTYGARAGATTPSGGGYFSIQLVKYTSPSIENRVRQGYKTFLKPVTGVGDWAYANIKMSPVVGGTADSGQFVFGAKGYGVVINVRAKLAKTVKQPALKTLAKQIAAEL